MADDDPITVDYFELAYALGRALHDDEECFWAVVAELDKTFPGLGWHNAMTDGPATPVRTQNVFISGMRCVAPVGELTGESIRRLLHPPLSDEHDLFLLLADRDGTVSETSKRLLVLDDTIVYLDRALHFVTKDRNRL